MASFPFVSFQGGEAGKEVLARVNLEGYSTLAETMENWWPDPAGPMLFRPGLKFLVRPHPSDDFTFLVPFIFNRDQVYLLLLSDGELRIVQNGGVITRGAVTSSITAGTFATLVGWTNISSGSGAASAVATGLQLVSNGSGLAGVRQAVTTANVGSVHALDIEVLRGPVTLRIGSTAGGSELLPGAKETALRTGSHSIAFTPAASPYYVELASTSRAIRLVESIAVASAGDLVLETPWTEAIIPTLSWAQSGDVLTLSSGVGARKRIERRASASWSVTQWAEADGPLLSPNVDEGITMAPSVTAGNGTLTASKAYFKPGHVGALFELTHSGQSVSRIADAVNEWTDPIKVQGAGATARTFNYSIVGAYTATVVIQRSIGNTSSWADYLFFPTAGSFTTHNDGLDNQTVYYRIGIGSVYTSGSPTVGLSYTGGSSTGVVRVTDYVSPTIVSVEVIDTLAAAAATMEWAEGAWSDARSWPKGSALYDGRLWEGYDDRFAGSASDAYESFVAGEDADDAVLRSVASGRVEPIVDLVPLSRLVALTSGAEAEIRSSSFDEPITPSNLTVRNVSTYGAAPVHPEIVDDNALFISRSNTRAMMLVYGERGYKARPLHRMHRRIGRPGLTQIAVMRHPETRFFFVRSDGELLCKLHEPDEQVDAWHRVVTEGVIESVAVLPADDEDEVYVMVRRTINGATRRYLERLGSTYLDDAADARQLDCWVERSGAATTTITGASHLEGKTVKIWADGAKMPDRVVSGGQFSLPSAKSDVAYGLGYEGRYKSAKLAFGAQGGTALTMLGRPLAISVLLMESMPMLSYGQSFDRMDALKEREIESQYDSGPGLTTGTTIDLPIPEGLTRDPRFCLKAESPFWVQVQGVVITSMLNERG